MDELAKQLHERYAGQPDTVTARLRTITVPPGRRVTSPPSAGPQTSDRMTRGIPAPSSLRRAATQWERAAA